MAVSVSTKIEGKKAKFKGKKLRVAILEIILLLIILSIKAQ